jgi:hypothetical protein
MRPANTVMADFLRIDTEMGLTFSGIALVAEDQQKRIRTTQVARTAYDTITRLKQTVLMTELEADKLNGNLRRLRCELEVLGETF